MRPAVLLLVVAAVGCGRPPAEPTTPKGDPPAKAEPALGPIDAA